MRLKAMDDQESDGDHFLCLVGSPISFIHRV